MNGFDFGNVAPPMLFIAISLLLAHFFNDADAHRAFLERLRAKYILHKRGPIELLMEKDDFDTRRHIYEELLSFRSARIHFGLITLIILLGLTVSLLIVLHAIKTCIQSGLGALCVFLILIGFMMVIVCLAFWQQQRAAARRLYELETNELSIYGTVSSQLYSIIGPEVVTPRGVIYRISGALIDLLRNNRSDAAG